MLFSNSLCFLCINFNIGNFFFSVSQTGCIGICQYEPVVEIYEKDKEKVTYVKMTADKAKEVVEKHIKGGQIVTEYTIGASQI